MSRVKLPKWAAALDVLAVVMATIALSVFLGGGFRLAVFGGRLSVTDWWRPALWSVLAIALRHAVVRAHPLPQRVLHAIVTWWKSPDTKAVLPIHLATRAGVLAIGFLAVILVGYPASTGGPPWRVYSNDFLDLPARWDTGWYLGIASEGYQWNRQLPADYPQNIAFFPAFPMAMRYASIVFGRQPLWTGVAISLVAFFIGLVYFLRLARDHLGNDDAAATAVTLLATYPFAVFYSAAYTEGLFFLTLIAAVYHFRHDHLWRASAWGLACGLTRPNGCFLSVALGLMAVSPVWEAWRRRPMPPLDGGWARVAVRLLSASAPGLGMLSYSAFIYRLTGNPLQWTSQNLAWGRVYRGLDTLVTDRIDFIADNGFYSYASTQTIDLFYLLAVLFMLGAAWPVYRRFGLAYAVLILVTVLPPIAVGGLLSMGRVTSVLFPAFLWMAAVVPARHRAAWVAVFACLQGFVAVMFFTWRPIF